MRKLLIVLGVLFLMLLLFAGLQFLIAYQSGPRLEAESKTYIDEAVPAILSTMDKRVLLDRACVEFVDKYKDDRFLDEYFAKLKRLGKFKAYRGSSGDVHMYIKFPFRKMSVTAIYKAKAEFDAGTVEFAVSLVRRGGDWQIHGFTIDPNIFITNKSLSIRFRQPQPAARLAAAEPSRSG